MSFEVSEDILASLEKMLGHPPDRVTRLPGGANNLIFEIVRGASRCLAKVYFTHRNDPRDRLAAEFGMLTFLWRHGVRCVPEPLQSDPARQIGLYEFVEGHCPAPGQVTWPDVEQMIALLVRMWTLREEPDAAGLPAGSDACFSLRGFIENVGGRFERIRQALEAGGPIAEAGGYVRDDLTRVYGRILSFIQDGAQRAGLDMDQALDRDRWTLNPADHGFHNTLREANGRLRFLDFEYAGWDDPAQMICNALLQPAVPLPGEHRAAFLQQIIAGIPGDPALPARLRLIYPLLGFKWSLIMLNEFLPVSEERRRFAGTRPENRREEQLEKSRRRLREVEDYLDVPALFDG